VFTYQNGFSALADPTRRAIFERLAEGPRAVGELAAEFPVGRPAVSQHLKALKEAGWPADYSLVEGESALVFEPTAGGRWYERGESGAECEVGRVRECEPPHRVLIAWQLSPDYEVDPEEPTDVEIMFEPEGAGTRVTLEHRGFEVHGDDAARMRESTGGEGGWPMLLDLYAKAA
jgi:uncharacterized protein YndB with AHSA1/START domain